jgi:protein SCO1/2
MKRIFLLVLFTLLATTTRAEPDAATLDATVDALGRINGQALACNHREVAARARAIVIARVPKTREYGERFEQATSAAYLAAGGDKAACPAHVALTVELETTARPLAPPSSHELVATAEIPVAGINPRYLLQATHGRAIMDSDFRHQFQLITFGYTYCPDICPTTLIEMAAVLKQLGADAGRVQAIFISLDPERDTPKHLHQYLAFFDTRILGATASTELVRRTAENFKVRFEKVAAPKSAPGHYSIDHTSGMYLLAPGGEFRARFTYGMPVATILDRIREEMKATPPPPAAGRP